MKKILFIVLILSVFTACKKEELSITPISTGTTENFYQTENDFIQASNAIYNSLRTYPDRLINLSETRSDNLYAASVLITQPYDPINAFRTDVVSSNYILNAWNENFNSIFRANILLEKLEQNGDVIKNATLKARLVAEARFLRAFFYFDLVRYFGKVPLTTKTVSPREAESIPRSPVGDVYKVIIEDLQHAIAVLPPSYLTTNVGRATKYAAQSLLALVYMTRSGPTYGIDGPGLGLNEWNLALPLLNEVIDSKQFAVSGNYAGIFSHTNQNPTVNKEAIFSVMYISGLNNPVLGASFVSLTVPDAYFTTVLGKPAQLGGAGRPTSYDLYNSYENTDERKAFSYILHMSPLGIPGNRPFVKKYLDPTKVPVLINDWGINFIAIRYSDILMMKAECILKGAPGSQTDVDGIVNQIRLRSNASAMTNVTIDQLYAERRREFSGEGSRWFDLQRSGNLLTTMSAWITAYDELKQIQPIEANWIIYPVPQSQMDVKPGLYSQNFGY